MIRTTTIGGVALLVACAGPAAERLGQAVTTESPSGVMRTMSDGPTRWRDTTGWRLVLDHIVQPAEGGAGELGDPRDIAVLPDGRVFVVDQSPTSIRLYDATGELERTIGREGAGPGEYQFPVISVSDRWLVVHDPQLTRATIFLLDGTLVRSFSSSCCNFGPAPFVDSAGRIITAGFSMKDGVGRSSWVRFDSLGRLLDTMPFPEAMEPVNWKVTVKGGGATYNIPFAPVNSSQPLPDGGFVHGRTDRYEIIVSRNGRDSIQLFGRSGVVPVPIPSAYRDSVFQAKISLSQPLRGVASLSDLPTVFELWSRVDRDGQGNFWVTRGGSLRGAPVLDVFGPSGAFLGTVPRPWGSARTAWGGDWVAVLDTDAGDRPRVRVYRISR